MDFFLSIFFSFYSHFPPSVRDSVASFLIVNRFIFLYADLLICRIDGRVCMMCGAVYNMHFYIDISTEVVCVSYELSTEFPMVLLHCTHLPVEMSATL